MHIEQAEPNIIFNIALMCEAQPIIKYFKLKKMLNINVATIYQANNIFLCVTGIGQLNMAMATAFMAGKNIINPAAILLNIGIAGGKDYEIGDLIEVNKISLYQDNNYKNYNYYPVKLHDFKLKETKLLTNQQINNFYPDNSLVDMEGYGFFSAATKYVSKEQIWIGKIISDNNSSDLRKIVNLVDNKPIYNKDYISNLITNQLNNINKISKFYQELAQKLANKINHPQEFFIIIKQVKFSFAQKITLKKLLLEKISQYHNSKILLDILLDIGNAKKIIEYLKKAK